MSEKSVEKIQKRALRKFRIKQEELAKMNAANIKKNERFVKRSSRFGELSARNTHLANEVSKIVDFNPEQAPSLPSSSFWILIAKGPNDESGWLVGQASREIVDVPDARRSSKKRTSKLAIYATDKRTAEKATGEDIFLGIKDEQLITTASTVTASYSESGEDTIIKWASEKVSENKFSPANALRREVKYRRFSSQIDDVSGMLEVFHTAIADPELNPRFKQFHEPEQPIAGIAG